MNSFAKVIKRTSVAVAAASTVALIGAAPASAASTGVIEICSYGDYGTNVDFPDRGGISTTIVPAGTCISIGNMGGAWNNEPINIYGYFPHQVWLRGATFCGAIGGSVATYGNSSDHWVATPRKC